MKKFGMPTAPHRESPGDSLNPTRGHGGNPYHDGKGKFSSAGGALVAKRKATLEKQMANPYTKGPLGQNRVLQARYEATKRRG